ncbi:hypothetical protein B0T22DRAFT_55622 [Podospora appendiculata]|uniref:Zn(2)-C6 fungal-type domain-containing protein n=1 Tax=Podospora appendiculata TaxID=314037 RepID=A0AAE1CGN1_9PEZI|nr:hypothetical protein B0T22DRAFT_55622 [Podospora appendiculata]
MEDFAAEMSSASTSRQKNCNACVRSKRRCDKRAPICSRCAERKDRCVYAKTRGSPRQLPDFDATVTVDGGGGGGEGGGGGKGGGGPGPEAYMVNSAAPSSFSAASFTDFALFDLLGHTISSPPSASVSHQTTGAIADGTKDNVDTGADDPFFNFTGIDSPPASEMWLMQAEPDLTLGRPGTPADERVMKSYERMSVLCAGFESWQLYDPNTTVYYIINRIKAFPSDFATANTTPFMHRHLYKDHAPPYILACFSTSVMYENCTPANKSMMLRGLQKNVAELLSDSVRAATTPREKLARAQALFIYQVIRLFDGDVTLRAQGDQDIPLLQKWLLDLCRVRENLGDLPLPEDGVKQAQRPKDWERWIFAESVRRTILMSYCVLAMYEVLRKSPLPNDNGHDPWQYVHRWTLSRHLWEADSSFSFFRMWEEKKPHFVINNYSFDDFLTCGRRDAVDDFAQIMLSTYMGSDETRAFMEGSSVAASLMV